MAEIKFLATQERIERNITVDEYIALMDGDVKTMVAVMSKFVLNGNGGYMETPKARKLLGALTIIELKEAFVRFNASQEDAVVPPKSAASL